MKNNHGGWHNIFTYLFVNQGCHVIRIFILQGEHILKLKRSCATEKNNHLKRTKSYWVNQENYIRLSIVSCNWETTSGKIWPYFPSCVSFLFAFSWVILATVSNTACKTRLDCQKSYLHKQNGKNVLSSRAAQVKNKGKKPRSSY